QQPLDAAIAAQRQANLPEVTPVPSLFDQCVAGIVQIWLHDVTPQAGQTYRYRLRLQVMNPLFSYDSSVEDPEHASRLSLEAVSDWSEPINIAPATEYFVVGGSEETGKVNFEIFRLALGQWLQHKASFTPGEIVGTKESRRCLDPMDARLALEPKEIDFDTGCILVDCDFNKQIATSGFKQTTVEATVLTPAGKLMVRNRQEDQKSKRYRELQTKAKEHADEITRVASPGR
ncbi:MAG: hypothetical protein HQ546_10790, partial [Planctomycetes bacterium]|nr:hypothetical protein [Planctomycetota bacterium]